MSISKSRTSLCHDYKIGSHSLAKVDQMHDLGVIFDSKLSFVKHINYIIPNAFASFSFISRHVKLFSDPCVLKLLYTSYVRSKLEYPSIVWNPVQRVFSKFALRPLFRSHSVMPNYNSRILLLGIKPLKTRRLIASLLFVYDVLRDNVESPDILSSIMFAVPARSLRSSDTFRPEMSNSSLSCNEPITCALLMYNKLLRTHHLNFSMSRNCFAKRLIEIL